MDFEKLKEYLIEKKKYVVVIVLLVIGGLLYFQNNRESSVDNSELVTEQASKKDDNENVNNIEKSDTASSNNPSQTQSTTVTCDISGAVKHPGVYTLKNGARLNDLLAAAGGITKRANLKTVNRALLLKDQDKVYVPYKGEKIESNASLTNATSASSSEAASSSNNASEKININTASVQDLQKLSGIGEKRAQQIISYREQNGSFKSLEDLTKISGIGEKTLAKLKDQLEL
ncbi:competence protein ComEA [Lactobacillus colini]|uniref:Competence protein ComEA n=1 Tax=Lactobacillus colini TaxID=1819254 RepID=A0ABS4MDL1_9LACO|nr:helix-hairpin-helix domain-containing protein [Lactobacillus colini]MBP2057777.1 competence protein ComEA [Lactobacillus colini]